MRLREILKEDLDWGNGRDKDTYMSLKGLVNKNNGVFKSQKQQWFVNNKIVKFDTIVHKNGIKIESIIKLLNYE